MSSGSDSDEEFVPGEPEQLSEEDSADDETDLQFEKEQEHKAKKRKAVQEEKGKKKRKSKISTKTIQVEENPPEEVKAPATLDPEEEKKREEDLWAKFLEGTDSKPKPKEFSTVEPVKLEKQQNKEEIPVVNSTVQQNKEDEKARERRIFEFAGETIVVEDNVIKEKIKTDSPAAAVKDGPSRSRGGGLSSVLGQLNKKNKLSTLEKSKLDWNTFKKVEGIEEEIQSHNKGKAGYLDRQDFLERADVRQYEIERDLRMTRRSNR